MEKKEFMFSGFRMSGFLMLIVQAVVMPLFVVFLLYALQFCGALAFAAVIALIILSGITWLISFFGFMTLEPNEMRVMIFFGAYKGTFSDTGFFWVNPFYSKKKLSYRARNLDVAPIKVNDKVGNPVLIGLVVVWKLSNSYKAMFEIDAQTMAMKSRSNKSGEIEDVIVGRMNAFENFVKIQSDAALRQVAGQFAYDENEAAGSEITLRSGNETVNEQLVEHLNSRLSMAGINVMEARINYLAYAPEIASVMLRRQQASAIISAREKIVEGAVSMVKMALDKLKNDDIIDMDDERKAAMVSNLLVVLCADEAAQPVINAGTLNQ